MVVVVAGLRLAGQVEQVAGLEARLGGLEQGDDPGEIRRRVRRPRRHLPVREQGLRMPQDDVRLHPVVQRRPDRRFARWRRRR